MFQFSKNNKSKQNGNNKNKNKSNTDKDSNTNKTKSRVVKATPPPSNSTPPKDNSSSSINDNTKSNDNVKLATIQTEELVEKTQQWRRERINATNQVRKENKDKEVTIHRLNNHHKKNKDKDDDDEDKETTTTAATEVPPILTVASKHPDHKRKAWEFRIKDFLGKKTKIDPNQEIEDKDNDSPSEENDSQQREDGENDDLEKTKGGEPTTNFLLTSVAIAAVAVIVAIKILSRKR